MADVMEVAEATEAVVMPVLAIARELKRTGELLPGFGLLNCKQIPTFCSIDYRLASGAETSLLSNSLHENLLWGHIDDVESPYANRQQILQF